MHCYYDYTLHTYRCASVWYALGELLSSFAILLCWSALTFLALRWCAKKRWPLVMRFTAISSALGAMLMSLTLAFVGLSNTEHPTLGNVLFMLYMASFAAIVSLYSFKRRNG